MSQPQPLVVVTVAIDRYLGPDLTSSLLGAWSTAHRFDGGQLVFVLEHIREALGSRWAPATPEQIASSHRARQAQDVPWEQISLF